MSSYDKVVKLACKPKAAPPKAKYIDPIIAATWSDDGAVHDVCKALSPRIREPNAIVVFKALIVLHTMIRNGATDNVLTYLSSSEVLRLRNVSTGNWEGYSAPLNLQNYALYLDSRIRAYKDLKHDAVKVQAESNRDLRNSVSIEEEGYRGRKDRPTMASVPTRSKTIMGRKLRSMTVEKGLLRETKAVHNMIDTLVECRFYLDDLEDELTITALRMLVKDLLILFQAGNEGVINVLENYFEMSHVDAEEALKIYRHFCKQTEFVVEYLGVAKKLQNLLNVSVPNLKHAPVSLAGALQEYLEDPNFEQNRIEYKTNKNALERAVQPSTNGKKSVPAATTSSQPNGKALTSPKVSFASTTKDGPSSSSLSETKLATQGNNDVVDFFNSIEEGQPTTFNPQTDSPNTAYFQQQHASNPFAQMSNGQPLIQQPQVSAQPTGFLVAQQTAMPQPNPFGNFLTPQQTGHRPFSTYLPQQPTGFIQQQPQATGFIQPQAAGFTPRPQQDGLLQPQATGFNPFRQSMLIPQTTGMALFGGAGAQGQFPVNQVQVPQPMQGAQGLSPSFSQQPNSSTLTAPKPSPIGPGLNDTPARPASTPLTASTSPLSSTLQPVKTHQTGTRNPFGSVVTAQPPVPKAPTLFELSNAGSFNPYQGNQQQQPQQQQPPQLQQQQFTGFGAFSFENSALNPGATDISSVASSFSFSNTSKPLTKTATAGNSMAPLSTQSTANTATTTTSGSTFPDSLFSSSLTSQPTGTTNGSFSPSGPPSAAPLKPHLTGFSGLKAFKPSSSFGASLMESLPPIPGSGSTTPAASGLPSQTGISPGAAGSIFSPSSTTSPTQNGVSPNNYNFLSSQPTGATGGFAGNTPSFGSTLGVGLRPQMTGGGSANPFRASTVGNVGQPNFGSSAFQHPGISQPFSANTHGMQQQQQPQGNTMTSLI